MENELAEQAAYEHRISEAGWHILRDEQVSDGHVVEFQQGPPDSFHLKAATRTIQGKDRNDAYRHFLEELGVLNSTANR